MVMKKNHYLPGPSSTESGFPVLKIGSPHVSPAIN